MRSKCKGIEPGESGSKPQMNFYVGSSGFSYKEWKGSFFPPDLPGSEMLHFYGKRFAAVEINNTFYRLPERTVFEAWVKQVPTRFRFVLKAPRSITHKHRLKGCEDLVSELLRTAGGLKRRLGPLLFQLPPFFRKDAGGLKSFLRLLPHNRRAAFEFRHQSWFDAEIFDLLRNHKAALCIADAENDLNIPFAATTDWGYLRLRRSDYSKAELQAWARRVRQQKWKDVFLFFKHEDTGKAPALAKRFLELLA
jgi:uncharacterized protein YecE (DUF72 family)